MRTIAAIFLISLLLLSPAACAKVEASEIASALSETTEITLYSIEPVGATRDGSEQCTSPCFRGWSLLGKVAVHGKAMDAVRSELRAWLVAPEPEAIAMCFNPRHGVRVVTPKHTYDFIVCFECDHAEVYVDSSTLQAGDLFRSSDQSAWDALLKSAGVKLAPPPDEYGI